MKVAAGLGSLCAFGVGTYCFLNTPSKGHNSRNSHINKTSGHKKKSYSRVGANTQALKHTVQYREVYKPYECPHCNDYHIGRTRNA